MGLVIISFILSKVIFRIFFKLEPEILKLTIIYYRIISIGIWMTMCLFIYSSFFKVQEKTQIIMKGSLLNNITNVTISSILVLGLFGIPKLGVLGAGIGTVSGLTLNLLWYYIWFKKISYFKIQISFDYKIIQKIFKKYIPILIQDFIEDGFLAIALTYILIKINPYLLGSFNFLGTISNFMLIGLYSYATISMNLIIKNKDINHKRMIPLLSCFSMIIILICFTGILFIFKKDIFQFYTTQTWIIANILPVFFINAFFLLPNIFVEIYKYALNGLNKENFIVKSLFIQKSFLLFILFLLKPKELRVLIIIIGLFQFCLAILYITSYYKIVKKKEYII